jgi:glycosyltransferase involved in cell wall biosynthesis
MKTICLSMIVKNECSVIERCLASVKPLIDHWIIVDTGSTDGTQRLVQTFLQDIPGTLYERPWVDFSHNRNEALDLSKNLADYFLFIDADERLVFTTPFCKKNLSQDYYLLHHVGKNIDFLKIFLIKNDPYWRWEGEIHEFINNPTAIVGEVLEGAINEYNYVQGCRSNDPDTLNKDINILEKALQKDPSNNRNVFYLAQSYAKQGQLLPAIKQYEKRISLGKGNTYMSKEEVFWSFYNIGCLQHSLQFSSEIVIESLLKAFHFDETRAEPLYRLAMQFQLMDSFIMSYLLIKHALTLPVPTRYVRMQRLVYEYLLQLKLAECAYFIGKTEESISNYQQLLANKHVPEEIKEIIKENLRKIQPIFPNTFPPMR